MRVMPALLFLLCACLVRTAATAQELPTADQIELRNKDAMGPVPDDFRQKIVGSGSLGETTSITYHDGENVRVVYERGGIVSQHGKYDGESWVLGSNGLVRAAPPDPEDGAKDVISKTVTRVSQPFDAYVVTALNVRKAGSRSYYDPVTFLLKRKDDFDSTGTLVTDYSDFAKFGARTLATNWTEMSKENQLDMHYRRVEYVTGGTAAGDLEEPVTLRRLVEFPAGVTSVDLPVKIVDGDIVVHLTIGSHGADFLLDSGAANIAIDTDFAKSIGLSLANHESGIATGRFTSYTTRIPEIKIGTLEMHDIEALVAPLPDVYRSFKPVGLLGFDFLAQLGVTIDYEHGRVTVVPSADFKPPSDPSTIPFDIRLGDAQPTISISVDGAIADRMIIATGCSCQLAFFDYFTRRNPHVFRDFIGAVDDQGVGKEYVRAEVYRLRNVKIGTIDFQDFNAQKFPLGPFPDDSDGLIGNDMLQLFNVSLDFTRGQLYLTPSNDTKRAMKHER